jgi:hypothetical protein
METKVCRKCGERKPLDEFYEHPQMADGHLNQCKACKRAYQKRYREEHHKEICEYDRQRAQTEQRKQYALERERARRRENPEKYQARTAVHNALRDGKITKPDACEDCGDTEKALQGHHEDYSKPLDVKWLCFQCHRARHGQIVEIEGDPF